MADEKNNNTQSPKILTLKKEIADKRDIWRRTRTERMSQKNDLLRKGLNKNRIRKEKTYKKLKKEQCRLSKEIRHLEIKLNRLYNKKR